MWGVVRVWPSGRGEGGGDVGGDAAVLPTAFQVGRAPRLPPPCPFFFAPPRLHQTLPTTHRPLPSPPLSSPTVRGRRGGRGANAGGGRWGADAAPPRRHLTASAGGRGRASATVAKTHGGSSPPLGVGAAHAPKYFRAIPWRRPGGQVGERVSAVTPPPIVHSPPRPPPRTSPSPPLPRPPGAHTCNPSKGCGGGHGGEEGDGGMRFFARHGDGQGGSTACPRGSTLPHPPTAPHYRRACLAGSAFSLPARPCHPRGAAGARVAMATDMGRVGWGRGGRGGAPPNPPLVTPIPLEERTACPATMKPPACWQTPD